MKIAVTFENGEVFQHFGHTEHFKLYEIEAGQVVSSEIIDTNGSGHEALAGFLADQLVTCLICDEISPEAQTALDDWGIQLYAGCAGSADDRAAELLAGTLHASFSTARSSHHL